MNNLLSIAKIVNFHGIKGEVKVGYTKGRESQLLDTKVLYLKINDTYKALNISGIRFHKGYALAKFEEINSINEVEEVKGQCLYVDESIVKKHLEKDEYLISDLNGLIAYSQDGKEIGAVTSVGENIATNIIGIKDLNGKIHLVPFVRDLVPTVDISGKKIVINDIEGLLD